MLALAQDVKTMADEVWVATVDKACELSLAYENVITVGCRAKSLHSERSSKLHELFLVASMVCAHLSPPPSIEAPLIDRLWELSDRALSPKAFAEVVASPLAEWFL